MFQKMDPIVIVVSISFLEHLVVVLFTIFYQKNDTFNV